MYRVGCVFGCWFRGSAATGNSGSMGGCWTRSGSAPSMASTTANAGVDADAGGPLTSRRRTAARAAPTSSWALNRVTAVRCFGGGGGVSGGGLMLGPPVEGDRRLSGTFDTPLGQTTDGRGFRVRHAPCTPVGACCFPLPCPAPLLRLPSPGYRRLRPAARAARSTGPTPPTTTCMGWFAVAGQRSSTASSDPVSGARNARFPPM